MSLGWEFPLKINLITLELIVKGFSFRSWSLLIY